MSNLFVPAYDRLLFSGLPDSVVVALLRMCAAQRDNGGRPVVVFHRNPARAVAATARCTMGVARELLRPNADDGQSLVTVEAVSSPGQRDVSRVSVSSWETFALRARGESVEAAEERQKIARSKAAEKSAKYRKRKRLGQSASDPVTGDVTPSVTVTGGDAEVTRTGDAVTPSPPLRSEEIRVEASPGDASPVTPAPSPSRPSPPSPSPALAAIRRALGEHPYSVALGLDLDGLAEELRDASRGRELSHVVAALRKGLDAVRTDRLRSRPAIKRLTAFVRNANESDLPPGAPVPITPRPIVRPPPAPEVSPEEMERGLEIGRAGLAALDAAVAANRAQMESAT
jgi:hypothetical protein